MITPEKIAELRALLVAANITPEYGMDFRAVPVGLGDQHRDVCVHDGDDLFASNLSQAEAALLVGALTALPELLDSLEQAQAVVTAARQVSARGNSDDNIALDDAVADYEFASAAASDSAVARSDSGVSTALDIDDYEFARWQRPLKLGR